MWFKNLLCKALGIRRAPSEGVNQDDGSLELKKGDMVILKSGGPISGVIDLDETTAWIGWRDENGVVTRDSLPRPCLYVLRQAV